MSLLYRLETSHLCAFVLILTFNINRTRQENPLQCGIPQITETELIHMGHSTTAGDWPWHAAVYHRDGPAETCVCGGTLISEQYVLTAAHCTINPLSRYNLAIRKIFVRLGVYDLHNWNQQSLQQHNIHKIHLPINFTGLDFRNDIAILELDTLARLNNYVQPACVSVADSLTGQHGTVIGWGVTEKDVISPTLKSAGMPVIDNMDCLASNRNVFGATLDKSIFCAGYLNGTNVCNGDSGGGIFFHVANAWYLGGIVSYTQKRHNKNLCQTKSYGAFTNVRLYLPWISSVTNLTFENADDVSTADDLRPDFEFCEVKEPDPSTTYPNLLPRNCGRYTPNRIVQGSAASVFEFPWMALFRYKVNPENEFDNICAGSLINKRYVLTSINCVKSSKGPFKIRLGEHTIGKDRDCNGVGEDRECAPPVREYGIECVIRHNLYHPRSRTHNIALVRLNRDVVFDDHIQPICLPATKFLESLNPERYIVTGWGATGEQYRYSKVLQKAVVIPAKRSGCQKWMNVIGWQLAPSQLCVGEVDGADACQGDGGGPLGYSANYHGQSFVQFGIVSHGSGCGVWPSVYTKVAYYMPWIRANMKP
nr:serine protease 7-like [Aedes albopictus]